MQRRKIKTAGLKEGYVHVITGLLPGEWLLRDLHADVQENERIAIKEISNE